MLWVYIISAYVLGTFLTAAVVGRLRGIDISKAGSGNLGARNAGRVLGKWAFFSVMIGDGLKGVIVVLSGQALAMTNSVIALALLCAVFGHVYPFWRKFRGGKGVATLVGGLLFFQPWGIVWLVSGFSVVALITRSSTKGMYGAFVVYSVMLLIFKEQSAFFAVIAMAFVVWANKQEVKE